MTKVFGIELNSVSSCAQVSALADGAVTAAVEFMAKKLGTDPTFETYNAIRIEWRCAYLDQRGLDPQSAKTATALDVAWSRNVLAGLKEDFGFDVPKSATKAATEKAATRKAKTDAIPDAVKAAQNLTQLDAITPTDEVTKVAVAEKRAALMKAALKDQEAALRKHEAAKLENFVAFIKALSPAERDTFYALRDKRFGVVLAVMPEDAISAGLAVQHAANEALKAMEAPKEAPAPAGNMEAALIKAIKVKANKARAKATA